MKKTSTRNLNTLLISNKTKSSVIYLCACVLFESFRRDFNEAKAVYISEDYLICRFVNMKHRLRLKFRETSLTINSHRGRHSQELSSGLWLQLSGTILRSSSRGYVRGNTRRWTSTAAFGYKFRANTSSSTVRDNFNVVCWWADLYSAFGLFSCFFHLWLGIWPLNSKRLQTT